MSVHVTSWAWKQPLVDHGQKLVLLKLADNANDDGVCWPSQRTLAAECSMGERTVNRKIAELEAAGYLAIRRRGKRKSNVYTLQVIGQSGVTLESDTPTVAVPKEPSLVLNNGSNEPLLPATVRILQRKELEELWGACETYVQTPPTAKSPRAAYAKLVREIHEAGWTPDDVEVRAEAYRKHPTFSKCELTLAALAKWGETFQTETQTREQRMAAIYRKAGMV